MPIHPTDGVRERRTRSGRGHAPGQIKAEAVAWISWAATHVERLAPLYTLPRLPDAPEPRADDLRPLLWHWSLYGPWHNTHRTPHPVSRNVTHEKRMGQEQPTTRQPVPQPLQGAHHHTGEGSARRSPITHDGPSETAPPVRQTCFRYASDIAPSACSAHNAHSEKQQVSGPYRQAPESPRTPHDASSGTDRTPAASAPCTHPPRSTPGRVPAPPGRRPRRRCGGRPGP